MGTQSRRAVTLFAASMAALMISTPLHASGPKAYVINEIEVTNAAEYKKYADAVPPTLTRFGGIYLTKGGAVEVIAGVPPAGRVVILEFPGREQAKAWHESPEYQRILTIRNATSTSRVYIVDGVAP